jgi:peroxiredoxin
MTEMLAIAKFLPDIELPSAQTGKPIPLRPSMGQTTILVSLHSTVCEGCRRYVEELASSSPEFEVWDGRLVIVAPGPRTGAEQLRPAFGAALADPSGQVSSPGDAAVIIADRYGHIYEACHAGEGHGLPSPQQLVEWLKFLGTLCPE